MRILLADDSRYQRTVFQKLIESWGHDVLLADCGDAALAVLAGPDPPQLAILDWEMPGKTGPEVCAAVRKLPGSSYIYIILLTAKTGESEIAAGLDAGADDFLSKPPNTVEMRARVNVGERILAIHEQLIQAREALRFEAAHDALTGLWNRGAILKLLENEFDRSRRQSTPVAIMMADIDNFKKVNDQFGHLIGDRVLTEVARSMGSVIRPYDNLGRWGGEEFLAVLPGAGLGAAAELGERLRLQVAGVAFADSMPPRISVSIGMSVFEGSSQSVNELIQAADAALYRAKGTGKNRVELAQ